MNIIPSAEGSLFLLSMHGKDVKMSNFPFLEDNKNFCLLLKLDVWFFGIIAMKIGKLGGEVRYMKRLFSPTSSYRVKRDLRSDNGDANERR